MVRPSKAVKRSAGAGLRSAGAATPRGAARWGAAFGLAVDGGAVAAPWSWGEAGAHHPDPNHNGLSLPPLG
jgi:hypothetical protein